MDQKKGNTNPKTVHHVSKLWLILSFFGSAYPKSGEQPKGGAQEAKY